MKRVTINSRWHQVPRQVQLLGPLKNILPKTPPLRSKCNKPHAMNPDKLANILTYFYLQEYSSGRELIQTLQEDTYVRNRRTSQV